MSSGKGIRDKWDSEDILGIPERYGRELDRDRGTTKKDYQEKRGALDVSLQSEPLHHIAIGFAKPLRHAPTRPWLTSKTGFDLLVRVGAGFLQAELLTEFLPDREEFADQRLGMSQLFVHHRSLSGIGGPLSGARTQRPYLRNRQADRPAASDETKFAQRLLVIKPVVVTLPQSRLYKADQFVIPDGPRSEAHILGRFADG